MPPDTLTYLLAGLVAVVAVARITRLLIFDAWPPTRAVRRWYLARTDDDGWAPLLTCPFCLATWPALADLVWAWAVGVTGSDTATVVWWLVNVWLAGMYAAAMVVVRDEPDDGGH